MGGYVDLHSHVLPGIDDGAPDLDEALAMLAAAAASGTATIAATPHLGIDFPGVHVGELWDRCEELRDASTRAGIAIELVSGAEVSLTWALDASPEERTLATFGQRGTDLLVETPSLSGAGLEMLLSQLRDRGLRITLAHPERSRDFQRNPERLSALARQGVLLQLDASSLLSEPRGSPAGTLARHLCVNGLAHAIASDGHRASAWRPVTSLAQAAPAAATLVGAQRTAWMTTIAPAAIIAGSRLDDAPPIVTTGKRRWRLRRR